GHRGPGRRGAARPRPEPGGATAQALPAGGDPAAGHLHAVRRRPGAAVHPRRRRGRGPDRLRRRLGPRPGHGGPAAGLARAAGCGGAADGDLVHHLDADPGRAALRPDLGVRRPGAARRTRGDRRRLGAVAGAGAAAVGRADRCLPGGGGGPVRGRLRPAAGAGRGAGGLRAGRRLAAGHRAGRVRPGAAWRADPAGSAPADGPQPVPGPRALRPHLPAAGGAVRGRRRLPGGHRGRHAAGPAAGGGVHRPVAAAALSRL
ncbi:MAG: hypothetical protein AVDCRST_MAG61-796, partial [uncultured Friedmanniella sp.]